MRGGLPLSQWEFQQNPLRNLSLCGSSVGQRPEAIAPALMQVCRSGLLPSERGEHWMREIAIARANENDPPADASSTSPFSPCGSLM